MFHWKYEYHSQTGTSHIDENTPCQDAVFVTESENCIIAALADGVGSLPNSHHAALVAVKETSRWFEYNISHLKKIPQNQDLDLEYIRSHLLSYISEKIRLQADVMQLSLQTMDCNLAFVCIVRTPNNQDWYYAGRLGDCGICILGEENRAITSATTTAMMTDSVLSPKAQSAIYLERKEISSEIINGFILTSDGLDNIVYMKGSTMVCKKAEEYFNAVLDRDPKQKLAELFRSVAEIGFFDDDLSIAVISRLSRPLSLPNDPTWLCVCEQRNPMSSSYCLNCQTDFTKLYRGINYDPYGSRAEFFRNLNRYEALERSKIGLPPRNSYTNPSKGKQISFDWASDYTLDNKAEAESPPASIFKTSPTEELDHLKRKERKCDFTHTVTQGNTPSADPLEIGDLLPKSKMPNHDQNKSKRQNNARSMTNTHQDWDSSRSLPSFNFRLSPLLVLLLTIGLVLCLGYCFVLNTIIVSQGKQIEHLHKTVNSLTELLEDHGNYNSNAPDPAPATNPNGTEQTTVSATDSTTTPTTEPSRENDGRIYGSTAYFLFLRKEHSHRSPIVAQLNQDEKVWYTSNDIWSDGSKVWVYVTTSDSSSGWCLLEDIMLN